MVQVDSSPARGAESDVFAGPQPDAGGSPHPWNPTQLEVPAFLVNAPFSYSTEVANNVWMQDLDEAAREPDHRRAMMQFRELYRYLSADALVYVLPTPRACGLQDLVFTGNLGIVLEHVPEKDVVILSNFTSELALVAPHTVIAIFTDDPELIAGTAPGEGGQDAQRPAEAKGQCRLA